MHLTLSDYRKAIADGTTGVIYHSQVASASEYYPFGMLLTDGNYSSGGYRFGFNGKEMDNEVSGTGNIYDYGFRIYNPRIGKFLSVDPLTASYPWYTPYQFAGNKPIKHIDLDGLEEADPQRKALAMKAVLRLEKEQVIKSRAIANLNKQEIIGYLKARLKDPSLKSHFNSCGPTSAAYVAITHDPVIFVLVTMNLFYWGEFDDGSLVVPDNLKNSDKHYYTNDDIDQLIEGTLRYSENNFGGYLLEPPESSGNDTEDNLLIYKTNATLLSEYDDFLSRMGASVRVSWFKNVSSGKVETLSKWTSSGKYLVLFGYYSGMLGADFEENFYGGDHFVTVTSIKTLDNGNIQVKFWHHGEKESNNGYENMIYTKEEFDRIFTKYAKIINTGNTNED